MANWITAVSTFFMAIATIVMAIVACQAKKSFLNDKKFDYSIKLKNKIIEIIDFMQSKMLSIENYNDTELTQIYNAYWNLVIESNNYFFILKPLYNSKNAMLIKEMLSNLMLWRMSCDITNETHKNNRNNLIPIILSYRNKILEVVEQELKIMI